jgi:hypothetical protein
MMARWKWENFFSTKRKLYEILVLFFFSVGLTFLWHDYASILFFAMGFIWNWSASQKVDYVLNNKRYRFSFLKMVYNLQFLFLYPLKNFHPAFGIIAKILPAGLFWWMIVYFANSHLPVLPTFIGSLVYELIQLDSLLIKDSDALPVVDNIPELPKDEDL